MLLISGIILGVLHNHRDHMSLKPKTGWRVCQKGCRQIFTECKSVQGTNLQIFWDNRVSKTSMGYTSGPLVLLTASLNLLG